MALIIVLVSILLPLLSWSAPFTRNDVSATPFFSQPLNITCFEDETTYSDWSCSKPKPSCNEMRLMRVLHGTGELTALQPNPVQYNTTTEGDKISLMMKCSAENNTDQIVLMAICENRIFYSHPVAIIVHTKISSATEINSTTDEDAETEVPTTTEFSINTAQFSTIDEDEETRVHTTGFCMAGRINQLLVFLLLIVFSASLLTLRMALKQNSNYASLQGTLSTMEQHILSAMRQDIEKNSKQCCLVLKGIEECEKGMASHDKELMQVLSVLHQIDNSFDHRFLSDFRRLGEYNGNNTHPRPLLLKLRPIDVKKFISKRWLIQPPITIEQYKTETERLLFKEKNTLKKRGVDNWDIKIQGSSLYVQGRLYATVRGRTLAYVEHNNFF